ncbi:hypothetical protein NFI96_004239 [Prochilodus magdalenae]|nr:hypothetical protein NFI96_004239 [Prochilodus magdalenae]
MERVLSGVPRSCCVVYLDDVLAHGRDFDSALSHLEVVLMSGAGVETDPKKTEAVRDWPTPRVRFCWSDEAEQAFQELKRRLCNTPVLAYPNLSVGFIVDTDASDRGLAERNYCVTRRELLAWLMRFREPEGQLARWMSRLQEFNFEVVHRPGRNHISADVSGTAGVVQVSVEQLCEAQRADRELSWAVRALNSGAKPSWGEVVPLGPVAKALRSNWDSFNLDSVLRGVHGSPGAGHFGVTKTLRRLRQRFYWPGCRADVELFSGSPMERVAVDVLGPFPVTDSGNRYVLVAVDYFTKWPEAYAVPDQGAVATAEVLVREFFCRFGVPEELHSDQGRNFESEVMAGVCRILGIHKTRTTPLHPQSDGLVERFNRTLAAQLAIVTDKNQRDWDRHLPVVLLACRSAVQETTGFTPALLMFGRELRTPVTLAFGAPPGGSEEFSDTPAYVAGLLSALNSVHGLTRSNQSAAGQKQKRAYDMRCFGDPLVERSRVWLYNPQRKKGLCPKLQSAWVGPCVVLSRLGEVVYRIRWGRRTMIVHRDRLAPYRPRASDADGAVEPTAPGLGPDTNSGSSEPLAGSAVPGPSRPQRARRQPARLNDCNIIPDTLDTLQFVYRPNRSTKDAICTAIHAALEHLESKDSYLNTSTITKKAQQRLYFLRRLRKAHLPPPILTTFYRGTIESILSSCITAWFGNCTASDRKSLQRVVRTAEKIIGVSLSTITDIYTTRCIRKANSIVDDYTHPLHPPTIWKKPFTFLSLMPLTFSPFLSLFLYFFPLIPSPATPYKGVAVDGCLVEAYKASTSGAARWVISPGHYGG